MNRFRLTNKVAPLLLLILFLHVLAHNLTLPKLELASLQEKTVCTSSITANGTDEETLGDFKPPKHSFIDYSTFFAPKNFLPAYNPILSKLLAHEPFQALPNVYLDINVPPNNLV